MDAPSPVSTFNSSILRLSFSSYRIPFQHMARYDLLFSVTHISMFQKLDIFCRSSFCSKMMHELFQVKFMPLSIYGVYAKVIFEYEGPRSPIPYYLHEIQCSSMTAKNCFILHKPATKL